MLLASTYQAGPLPIGGSVGNWDITITGALGGDLFGQAGAAAGDIDGDGLGDLVIGAPTSNLGGVDAGAVSIFLGSQLSPGVSLDATQAFATIVGEDPYDQLGYSVAGRGDVDGDGLSDVLIGAPYGNDGGGDAGAAWLFLGATIVAGGVFFEEDADAVFLGLAPTDQAGSGVAILGDVDGDGRDEIAIAAPSDDSGAPSAGAVYILLSPY